MIKTLDFDSDQLRDMISNAVHFRVEESSKDDGCMHGCFSSKFDCFSARVPIKEFLSAYIGCEEDAITLCWSSYNWRYTAKVKVSVKDVQAYQSLP